MRHSFPEEFYEIVKIVTRARRTSMLVSLAIVSIFGTATTIAFVRQQQEISQVHRLGQAIQTERYQSCIMGNEHNANLKKVVYALLAKNNQHPTKLQNAELMDEIDAIAPLHNCAKIKFLPTN